MSDDTACMLAAAGVALFFVAILQLRGSYLNFTAKCSLSKDWDVKWAPSADAILNKIDELAPGWSTSMQIRPATCSRMCRFLKTRCASVFQDKAAPTEQWAITLANRLASELKFQRDPTPRPWSHAPKASMIQSFVDFGSNRTAVPLVDIKYVPDGLLDDGGGGANDDDDNERVQLCIELVTAGHRLLAKTGKASDVDFSPSLHYPALVRFHYCGFDTMNMNNARTHCYSGPNDEPVDLGNPDAFWGLDVDHKAVVSDFRTAAQRVRQHEFVRHYLRIVAQTDSFGDGECDDVTVMMNMSARLDRMWRCDFTSHGIDVKTKAKLRSEWQGRFGKDAQRATVDMAAVVALGEHGGVNKSKAKEVVQSVHSEQKQRQQQYMNIEYQWPSSCTPELQSLRHELNIFAYNRESLPFDMERLALDIVAVEARCVQVFAALDSMPSTKEAQHTWAIVCFAMFTIFDLRPIFMTISS